MIQVQVYRDDVSQKYLLMYLNLLECHSDYGVMQDKKVDLLQNSQNQGIHTALNFQGKLSESAYG